MAAIVSEGAVPRLVRMLDSDPEDQAMMQSALLAIESLCSDIGNLRLFAQEGKHPLPSFPSLTQCSPALSGCKGKQYAGQGLHIDVAGSGEQNRFRCSN